MVNQAGNGSQSTFQWGSAGSRQIAEDLLRLSNEMRNLLENEMTQTVNIIKTNYTSNVGGDALYAKFDQFKSVFPNFYTAISDCSKYLSDVVAPAYDKFEQSVQTSVQ